MSLFLGKIHYWLFNKILWFEDIEGKISEWSQSRGIIDDKWISELYGKFGAPTENKPLEEIIDKSNIHGWLQAKIESAELRQAALVTRILDVNPDYKKDLLSIFESQGIAVFEEDEKGYDTPEEIYNLLNDFILEGMPCDRVNEIVKSDESEMIWETTRCLHKPYWDRVGGDVQDFYDLREAWIKSFVSSVNPKFEYIRLPGLSYKISRKG